MSAGTISSTFRFGYYDEEDCQCCYDYVSHTDPETMASRAMLAKFGSGLYVGNRTMLCASSQMMTSKLAAKSGLKLLFRLCVAVFVFKDDFISASGLEFFYLPVDVLLALVCGATRVSVYHRFSSCCQRKGQMPDLQFCRAESADIASFPFDTATVKPINCFLYMPCGDFSPQGALLILRVSGQRLSLLCLLR